MVPLTTSPHPTPRAGNTPGADSRPLTEMGEMAASMERTGKAQAAAMATAAAERTAASMDKTACKRTDTAAKERMHGLDHIEKAAERVAASTAQAETNKILLAAVQGAMGGSGAAPPAPMPPPGAARSSSSREPRLFDSLEDLLTQATTAPTAQGLLELLSKEDYRLTTLYQAYRAGETSIMSDLKEIGILLSYRRQIMNALDGSPV